MNYKGIYLLSVAILMATITILKAQMHLNTSKW